MNRHEVGVVLQGGRSTGDFGGGRRWSSTTPTRSSAYPFQRPDEDWQFGFVIWPGW